MGAQMKYLTIPKVARFPFFAEGSLLLAEVGENSRWCISTKFVEGRPRPAVIVLGPFLGNDPGVPWLDFEEIQRSASEFQKWEPVPQLSPDKFNAVGYGNSGELGALIYTESGKVFLQCAMQQDSNAVVYYNFQDKTASIQSPNELSVAILKWSAVIELEEPIRFHTLINVEASGKRSDT